MLSTQRHLLHQEVARWYEKSFEDLGSHLPLLAHHWHKANVPQKAVEYLAKAGEQAMRGGSYLEAHEFFSQALELDPAPAEGKVELRRAHWTCQLGEACYCLGRASESTEHLHRALTLAGLPHPSTKGRWVFSLLKNIVAQLWLRITGNRGAKEGADDGGLNPMAIAANAYERLVEIAYFNDDRPSLVLGLLRWANFSERAGPAARHQLPGALSTMTLAFGSAPMHGLAERYKRLAEAAATKTSDPSAQSMLSLVVGVYAAGRARFDVAEAAFEDCRRRCEESGNTRRLEETLCALGPTYCWRGKLDEALACSEDLVKIATRQGDEQALGWGLLAQSLALQRIGDLDEAARCAEEAGSIFHKIQDTVQHLLVMGLLVRIHVRRDDLRAAGEAADLCSTLMEQTSAVRFALVESQSGLAEYHLARWEANPEVKDLRRAAYAACNQLKEMARIYDLGRPLALVLLARLRWLDGKLKAASRLGQQGIALAREYGMPYVEAMGHHLRGMSLPRGAERDKQLTRAVDLFEGIGARSDAERAREKLKQS